MVINIAVYIRRNLHICAETFKRSFDHNTIACVLHMDTWEILKYHLT